MHPLTQIIQTNRETHKAGIYSCCSANRFVLEAALVRGKQTGTYVLIEATANQVNQYGGYTGMVPRDFVRYVKEIAFQCEFPEDRLILGGDHLGPLTFANLPEEEAMPQAEELVRSYILAGFTKIHLDTSMKVASDDPEAPLPLSVVAARGARLCAVCEQAYLQLKKQKPEAAEPVYIVGSEVPIPGGAQEAEDVISVTRQEVAREAIAVYEKCFQENGLTEAWQRVAGLVVQPGVEFGDSSIFEYDMKAAAELKEMLRQIPGMTFEAHSTDYQSRESLQAMVADGFSILKVGPGLTFALREALFALDMMEREMAKVCHFEASGFRNVLMDEMHMDPAEWKKHYHGTEDEISFKLAFSFSDRSRYYLTHDRVAGSLSEMIQNLERHPVQLSLLSQFMPEQYAKVRNHVLVNRPYDLILDKIQGCIDDYLYATNVI